MHQTATVAAQPQKPLSAEASQAQRVPVVAEAPVQPVAATVRQRFPERVSCLEEPRALSRLVVPADRLASLPERLPETAAPPLAVPASQPRQALRAPGCR